MAGTTRQLTGTAAALGSVGVRGANRAVVVISGLSSETIAVTATVAQPSAGDVVTADLRPVNLTTGAVEATDSDLSNGSFLFDPLTYDDLIFTKSASSEDATVTIRTQ